ncbi:N-acetyltransferase [Actinoplanes ianthinogenes]|uniref:N-acetyltransferase n=1 Tax=Actinoplanes ianthinogenes TaxID=122358 RepID=A0ABM7M9Z4_9ACTN|nr:GNAT family N-acetyltransferase [Actinoplanes ianthinogenes]BCJ48446.1 N-acetyltransferase [Actinoplanes ianthinogenes]GGR46314.1 N-acetyltransferase [Actinoplanes ianthinogenes]
MSEPSIDVVPISGPPGVARWQAVAEPDAVAGTAALWPVPALRPDVPELSLYVGPQWRRRGIGSRLLTAVREQATEPLLLADVVVDSPGEAFCRWHGFRHTRSRRRHLLTYCDVHQAWLGELVDAEHPGYRLTHWTGDLPGSPHVEELLRSPSGPGNTVLTAAEAGGDLAAYSVAVVGVLAARRARQYGPAVLPGHRGRRLGRWVSAALIQRLREVHPDVTEIEAATAEDDAGLLATRAHLGFRLVRSTRLYELTLP